MIQNILNCFVLQSLPEFCKYVCALLGGCKALVFLISYTTNIIVATICNKLPTISLKLYSLYLIPLDVSKTFLFQLKWPERRRPNEDPPRSRLDDEKEEISSDRPVALPRPRHFAQHSGRSM